MDQWHEMNPAKIKSTRFAAVVEIPLDYKIEYELNNGFIELQSDRVLYSSTQSPANLGIIPRTLTDYGTPLNVLILSKEALLPLSLVSCRPIGIFHFSDEGELNDHIIAVTEDDPIYNAYKSVYELPQHTISEILYFFFIYKQAEGKKTELVGIGEMEESRSVVSKSIECYKNSSEG